MEKPLMKNSFEVSCGRTWTWLAIVSASGILAGCVPEQEDDAVTAAVTASAGVRVVYHADPSKCVDVASGSTKNNARIVIADCNSASKSQIWGGSAVTGSYGSGYQIINQNSGLCLDTTNASTAKNAVLDQYGCGPQSKADQAWKVSQSGTSYVFRSAKSGLCVDLTSHNTTDGTELQQYTCTASDTAQLFDLVPTSATPPQPDLGSGSSGHSVTLSWMASATGGVTYNLYRGTVSGGPYTVVQSSIVGTKATDATVSSNTTYYYVIRAQNAGGESGNSNAVAASIP
jgi:hypothetical protein